MNPGFRCFTFLSAFVLAVSFSPALAQWAPDGAPISTAVNFQYEVDITRDGYGGAIIVWADSRGGDLNIYAQRINVDGYAAWSAGGVVVCPALMSQRDPAAISDGAGGAIVVWYDMRATEWDLYAQRVNSSGARLWDVNGVAIATETSYQYQHVVVPDTSGGAIIVWSDGRAGNYGIYAQRINSEGDVQWAPNGVAICTEANDRFYPDALPDGAGGAIIVWEDRRPYPNYDIYAQRVNVSGIAQWTPGGVPLCTAGLDQKNVAIVTDKAGGAIVVWEDGRDGNIDIYGQRVEPDGDILWGTNGKEVVKASYAQTGPGIVTDGIGGAIVAWVDGRNGIDHIYAQRLNAGGTPLWPAVGEPVYANSSDAGQLAMVEDNSGGVYVCWDDQRNGVDYNIYAQRLNSSGTAQWVVDGVAVCTEIEEQSEPVLVRDGAGGAITAWRDQRNGAEYDTYAQGIDPDGDWGYPTPSIHSVNDIPKDQGGNVNLQWDASRRDPNPYGDITHYTIWRALSPAQAVYSIGSGATVITDIAGFDMSAPDPVIRVEALATRTYYWEHIDTQTAYYVDAYAKVVPTMYDSTASSVGYHYFQVIAHTSAPYTFYVSAPDSGYSVDNLVPGMPLGLIGKQLGAPDGLELSWLANTEQDLSHYNVYRGTTPDFAPGPGNLIGSPPDTVHTDGAWTWSAEYWYKVSAVDVHDNESLFAVLGPDLVIGTYDGVPPVTFLGQNRPNPFNPSTTIPFGSRRPGVVTVTVYDVSGRLVRILTNRYYGAGRHAVTWDGRDINGRSVGSGVYLYRLEAGGEVLTGKMLLIK